jgi:hypothetical protein
MKTINQDEALRATLDDCTPQHDADCCASFPDYGKEVFAITVNGESGVWNHGQYGWYPQGKWGAMEFPHSHIASWKPLRNVQNPPTGKKA